MPYDVVIATRNRADSLVRCLSCIEAQTQLPSRVIVVDASDDHDAVMRTATAGRSDAIEWVWLESTVRSIPAQRNLGLQHATSEVTLLPDDDSLMYPTAAAELVEAYAKDTEHRVAGVSALGAAESPIASDRGQITRGARWKARTLPLRNRIERAVFPRPFEVYPQALWRERELPAFLDGVDYVPVETIGGYLLSLRTDLARQFRFDETLGHAVGYAQHEDMDMSLRLQASGYLLIAAHRALIFHDVHPSKRANGFPYGFCWISNYLYAALRSIPQTPAARRQLERFLRYKLALYRVGAFIRRDEHSRSLSKGAQIAWRARQELYEAGTEGLADAYIRLCDSHLPRR